MYISNDQKQLTNILKSDSKSFSELFEISQLFIRSQRKHSFDSEVARLCGLRRFYKKTSMFLQRKFYLSVTADGFRALLPGHNVLSSKAESFKRSFSKGRFAHMFHLARLLRAPAWVLSGSETATLRGHVHWPRPVIMRPPPKRCSGVVSTLRCSENPWQTLTARHAWLAYHTTRALIFKNVNN